MDVATGLLHPASERELAPTPSSGESARGLLLSVLGEFGLPGGGVAWTRTLLALADRLGLRDKAARQALARMEQRGLLERERAGRETRWALSASATSLLTAGASRIYSFGQGDRAWSGDWLVVLASVPETDRTTRYRMTGELNWAGFGSLGQGTWLCPWVDRESAATSTLRALDVDATVFRARLGEMGSGPELAARAWDLPALEARYRQFLHVAATIDATAVGIDAAGQLVELVHEWRRFPFVDPDLPTELLPTDWPGHDAASAFAEARQQLSPAAQQWWADSEGTTR